MSDDITDDELAPGPKGSRLLPLLLALCVANLGAVGFLAMRLGKAAPPATAAGSHGDGKSGGRGGPPPPSAALEPFIVNLNEAGSSRYLKTSFEVELSSPGALEELTREKRAIRDQVLRYLSSLTVASTLGADGKSKIHDELIERINHEIGDSGRVVRLFFTEFVVQ